LEIAIEYLKFFFNFEFVQKLLFSFSIINISFHINNDVLIVEILNFIFNPETLHEEVISPPHDAFRVTI
jgi:hypothetical protein